MINNITIKKRKTVNKIIKERKSNNLGNIFKKNKRYKFEIEGNIVELYSKVKLIKILFVTLCLPFIFIYMVLGQGIPETIDDFKTEFPKFLKNEWEFVAKYELKKDEVLQKYIRGNSNENKTI